jgi:hypothetical protein
MPAISMLATWLVITVLVAVVEASAGDLGELAGSSEAFWRERVGRRRVDAPIGVCGLFAGGVDGLAAVEEAFVIAVPGVGLDGESVVGVWRALVVAVNHFDVLELETGVFDSRVALGVDVRHVTVVVDVQRSLA